VKLSVLMPAYNEAATVERALAAVLATSQEKEVILVDDGSTDGTREIITRLGEEHGQVQVFFHQQNQGKGAAVRTALAAATGDVVLIQDCDLEYDPNDYAKLLEPIERGEAQVVFGSRAFASHTSYSFWFVVGNKLVTMATNILFNCYISDMETCYKVMPLEVARKLRLTARGFELEPQITGGLLNLGYQIYEVPVNYTARTRAQGKKLVWRDGIRALQALVQVRMRRNGDRRRAGIAL
jgi:glycosyltransferase involved in cell wall biosynthesis